MAGHALPPGAQRLGVLFEQDDLQPGIQRRDGDARAHGAGTDHGEGLQRPGRGLLRGGRVRGFVLRVGQVVQGGGLRRVMVHGQIGLQRLSIKRKQLLF